MKKISMCLGMSALLLAGGSSIQRANAEKVKCASEAKKLKWNMCVQEEVEYKRGLKTVKRTECTSVKAIPAKGGCNLGDLSAHLPEGANPDKIVFYAVGPKGFDTGAFELQKQTDMKECGLKGTSFDAYQLMKFSDAFDKSNRGRGELVLAKMHKKKKDIMKVALAIRNPAWKTCKGVKSLIGQVDKKSQSKFLFYAEAQNK